MKINSNDACALMMSKMDYGGVDGDGRTFAKCSVVVGLVGLCRPSEQGALNVRILTPY